MNDINNKQDSQFDELKATLERARSNARNVRLTGLGFFNKMNKEAKGYIENIKVRSEDKLEDITHEDSEKWVDRVSVGFAKAINQSRAYGLSTYEEANENSQKLTEWVKAAFEDAKEEVEEDTKAISRLGRNVNQASAAFGLLFKETLDSTEEFLGDAKELGRDVDHELRKAIFGRQSSLEDRIQRFWKAIGLVNKQEMAEVNRKLVVLAETLENQLDEDSKTLVYLNRRKDERRLKQVPVAVEKRVHDRRHSDRRLAS